MKKNVIDRVLEYVAPSAAMRRARARHVLGTLARLEKRKYEGADLGRRTEGWTTAGGGSANAELGPAAKRLRDRSRDLVRNNAYAARAVSVIQSNVVGSGIVCSVRVAPSGAKPTKTQLAQADAASRAFNAWANSKEIDADGVHDLYGLESLVMRTVVESGECIVRRRRRRAGSGLAVPLQLQVLEPDYIDATQERRLDNGGVIIQGIEFDSRGRRVAYYLHTEHPGGTLGTGFTYKTVRVPADEIAHVYRVDRPGQVRGAPWAAPVMLRLKDFDDFEDAQLVRQKLASCFTAFVQDIDTSELSDAQTDLASKLEPGAIEFLPPGKTVTLASPPGVTGYAEYTTAILHAIASGFGVTYEALTSDYSQVNFSSARMGGIEFGRSVDVWRWNMLIPQFCETVFDWFSDTAAVANGLNFDGLEDLWTPPARAYVDPVKEISATRDAIRSGLTTPSEAIRERGLDPEKHFGELAQDFARFDSLGLVLDSDPRKTTATGAASAQEVNNE